LPTQSVGVYQPGAAFPIAQLNFTPKTRTTGRAGARLVPVDYATILKLITEARDDEITIQLQLQEPGAAPPAAVLPALRLQRGMVHPNSLKLTVKHEGRSHTYELDIKPTPDDEDEQLHAFVEHLENLAVIQDALGQPFPTLTEFTSHESDRAAKLRRLLAGEVVPWLRGPVTITIDAANLGKFKQDFPANGRMWRVSYDDLEESFGGHAVHIGPVFMTGAVTLDLDALPDYPQAGEEVVTATCEVGGDGWFHAERGVPDGDAGAEGGLGGRVSYFPGPLPGDVP
jgi:hypothetical protein